MNTHWILNPFASVPFRIFPSFLIIFAFGVSSASSNEILDMVRSENIPLEDHYVTTEDGYVLLVHRLPQPNSTKVMFMMHGLESASVVYLSYIRRSAGFYFHDLGYHVWMGNARGNSFSRNHTKLNPDNAEFWKFSWHEIGYYDLPAMIDYALKVSQQQQLIYVGHSQGVTTSFVMLSERPEYNDKIRLLHAMAPPVILRHYNPYSPKSMSFNLTIYSLSKAWVNKTGKSGDFRAPMKSVNEVCLFMKSICRSFTARLVGPISPQNYYDRILLDYSMGGPFGASYRQFMHYIQIALNGRFQKFDFGQRENLQVYGAEKPPENNFTNIKTKIHILYGTNDLLVLPTNMPELLKKIKYAIVAVDKVDLLNQLDFAFGRAIQTTHKLISSVIDKRTKGFFTQNLTRYL